MSDKFDNIEGKNPGPIFGWPRYRVIQGCTNPHQILLVRYFLLHTKPVSVFLHQLVSSDEDRALHDHPWSFFTLLLTGGYWEHTTTQRIWRRRFSLLYRPAEWAHRLELPRPVWTLVVKFRSRRDWGFFVNGVWQKWSRYVAEYCND
jgi:hypothetical protein